MITLVRDPSGVGEARRAAMTFARRHGIPEDDIARIGLVATEMVTNQVKHAGEGMIVVNRRPGGGIELLALDKGPGMADVSRCLEDGFSTAGSLGTGLGAISRNCDRFAIYSRPGCGTALMAQFGGGSRPASGLETGAIVEPIPGENVCGDLWVSGDSRAGPTLLLVDGSGHGPLAARAAEAAAQAFADNVERDCVSLVEAIHAALAPTRGAAVAVARFDVGAGIVRFVGVGNIAGLLASGGQARHMVSHNGTAGYVASRIREFIYPFTGNPLVILHSDGLSARWDLDHYPGLVASHPSLIAGVLFRDHRRSRDDAAVLASRAVS
jgi:anti-sigma regulatory factor (Ser/Thr protein kinase)